MQPSIFIAQLLDDAILGKILLGKSDFKFVDFTPPLQKISNELYVWENAVIGNYCFSLIHINVGFENQLSSYRSPIFMLKMFTDDLLLFEQSEKHFGIEKMAVEIPPFEGEDPLTREWRKKIGIYLVQDSEIKIAISKFASQTCVLKIAIYPTTQ